jgi:hypothetical protein
MSVIDGKEVPMGYDVTYTMYVVITNPAGALAAINDLYDPFRLQATPDFINGTEAVPMTPMGGVFGGGIREELPASRCTWYAGALSPYGAAYADVLDALQAWRFQAEEREDGRVEITEFRGRCRRQEDVLFKAIAPFVMERSWVEGRGEDGKVWRLTFQDDRVYRQDATITWSDPTAI